MFERFDEQAREVMVVAQDYARSFNHAAVYPDDMMLALYSVGPSIATAALAMLDDGGLEPRRQLVRELDLPKHEGLWAPGEQIPFTEDTKKGLENALREALAMGSNEIRPEHLLLGVCRLENVHSMPAVRVQAVRDAVMKKLMARPSPKHLIEWTPSALTALRTYLACVAEADGVLNRDAISLFELRAAVDEVAIAAAAFRETLEKTVLAAPGSTL